MNNKSNKPNSNYNWGKSGDMNRPSGNMKQPSGGMGNMPGSRPGSDQEPRRDWGRKHYHGHNADWGKEGGTVRNGPDLQWGETSRHDVGRLNEPGPETPENHDENEPIHPGHASNQGQGSDISRKAESRKGRELPKQPHSADDKDRRPNTDMDWSL